MEVNAFKSIAKLIEDRWYPVSDFGLIAGFHLKLSGINWSTSKELTGLLILMAEVGFIDIDPENLSNIRVKGEWIEEAKSI